MRIGVLMLAIVPGFFLACGTATEIQTVVVTATPSATVNADATVAAAVAATIQAMPTATTTPIATPIPTSTRVPTATFTPLPIATAFTGTWNISNSTSPLDDTETVIALIESSQGVNGFGDPIELIIRCKKESGEVDLYLNWGEFLSGEEEIVRYRLGGDNERAAFWGVSTNNQATFYPKNYNTIDYVKSLMQVDRFVAQVTPYNENPITAIFDVTGLDNVAPEILEACERQP